MIRPRGSPPMPSAMSRPKDPLDITSVSAAASRDPSFMIEPLPNARSICPSAASKARCLSIASLPKRRNAVCIVPSPYSIPNDAVQRRPEPPCVHLLFERCNTEVPALRNPCGEDVSHLGRQLLQAERLGQKLDTYVAVEALTERVLGIPRNEDYFYFRVYFPHFADEPGPVHMRHNDIGDQKIDRLYTIADQFERRFAASRLYYLVPLVAQSAGAENSDRIVILDEHDRTVPGQIGYCGGFANIGPGGLCRIRRLAAWQVNLKNRALARRAARKNKTTCLLDDTVYRRQTETSSGADLLGRKERVENASQVLLRDTGASIGHLDQHIVAGRHRLVPTSQLTLLVNICRANGERAAAGHCVARIHREIDDHLFKLPLVDLDKAEIAPMHDLELDVFPDQPFDQVPQFVKDIGNVEDSRLQRLLS